MDEKASEAILLLEKGRKGSLAKHKAASVRKTTRAQSLSRSKFELDFFGPRTLKVGARANVNVHRDRHGGYA